MTQILMKEVSFEPNHFRQKQAEIVEGIGRRRLRILMNTIKKQQSKLL